MKLKIDGMDVIAEPGESLLDILKRIGMAGDKLSNMPIAAKIAGEVFNLNYIPVRLADPERERPSIRRAMAASGGVIQLLRLTDPAGRDVYDRTTQFVVFLAIHQLWPDSRPKMGCTVGPALFVEMTNAPEFSAQLLKQKVLEIQNQNIPLIRQRITTAEAIERFQAAKQDDKAKLLSWRKDPAFDVYAYEDFVN